MYRALRRQKRRAPAGGQAADFHAEALRRNVTEMVAV